MIETKITAEVILDENRVPQKLTWWATESSADEPQPCKAIMLNFWDSADKAALRIDLWTKEMMVDEMGDFYFQTLMGMADSFGRSTGFQPLVQDMKNFAQNFLNKFQDMQQQQANKQ
jgi:gliding motility-associated protein GldC